MIMMCQSGSINCNNGTTLVEDGDSGEGCACVGTGSTQDISVPSPQFSYEPKTALKKNQLKNACKVQMRD